MPKLVRDRIPEIIRKNDQNPHTHQADKEEYVQALRDKLKEEVNEYLESHHPEELADILEVVYTLANTHHLSPQKLEHIRSQKKTAKGGFNKKIILDKVTD